MANTETLYALPDKVTRVYMKANAGKQNVRRRLKVMESDAELANAKTSIAADKASGRPVHKYFEHDGKVFKVRHLSRQDVEVPTDKHARKAFIIEEQANMRAKLHAELGIRVVSRGSNQNDDALGI